MILYRFRLNIGRREMTFGLTGRHLLIGEGTTVHERIPLAEIVGVNLQSHETAFRKDMFRCVIRTRRKTIKLSNHHYRGLANIEPRDHEYRRFVLSLHKALVQSGNQARFEVGHRVQATYGAVMTILSLLLLVADLGIFLFKGPVIGSLCGVMGLSGYFIAARRAWRMGTRKPYDPATPPNDYLPSGRTRVKAAKSEKRIFWWMGGLLLGASICVLGWNVLAVTFGVEVDGVVVEIVEVPGFTNTGAVRSKRPVVEFVNPGTGQVIRQRPYSGNDYVIGDRPPLKYWSWTGCLMINTFWSVVLAPIILCVAGLVSLFVGFRFDWPAD